MSRTTMFVVSDDSEIVEQARRYWESQGVSVRIFSQAQWSQGLDSPVFRQRLTAGVPSLAVGAQPLQEGAKVLPFQSPQAPVSGYGQNLSGHSSSSKVCTMNELEAKAIEDAIDQFRGNLTEAAKALGIGRATLYRKVKQYQIDPSQARKKRSAA